VQDFGNGMTAEQLDKLFVPYVQIDARKNQGGKGTGLGLCICKHIVELMDGQIGCQSEENVGSEFHMTIPFEMTDQPVSKATSAGSSPAAQIRRLQQQKLTEMVQGSLVGISDAKQRSEGFTQGVRVSSPRDSARVRCLVVDDAPSNRKFLRRLLIKKCRMQVDTAANGEIAVNMAKKHDYQLILMDQQMDTMDGLEASRTLRAAGNKAVILGITGNAGFDDHQVFKKAGADEVLSKPVTWKIIEDTFKAITKGRDNITGKQHVTPK
jgi:CheY-like chemotaxis protein